MEVARDLYSDVTRLDKINEMRMYLKKIFMSEIDDDVQFYNHQIKFPPVEKTRSLQIIWGKFKKDANYTVGRRELCGNVKLVKWWSSGDLVSDGANTY